MRMDEYAKFDATALSLIIKDREISPKEVIETAIATIEQKNPKLNAVVTKMYDIGLRQLDCQQNIDGCLYGVPILLKDVLFEYKGVCMTMGSRLLRQYKSKFTSDYVKKLQDAGLFFLGKTNVPEFALMGTTEPKVFGPTRNPYNTEYSAGGSSGGSAAAVASGMVPIATGNDGGGSIRIPAAMCGLFGFKPSRNFTPLGPVFIDWMGLVVNHVITKSVRDSALILDLTFSSNLPISIAKEGSFLKSLEKPPKRLKIAVDYNSYFGNVDRKAVEATKKIANLLESLGHFVEEAKPKINYEALYDSYIEVMFVEMAYLFDFLEEQLGRKILLNDVETSSFILSSIGRNVYAKDMAKIKYLWDNTAYLMKEFHNTYDVYMTPTLADPNIKLGDLLPSVLEEMGMKMIIKLKAFKYIKEIVKQIAFKQLAAFPFTQLANQTGQPAMSIPSDKNENNIPIGVQFIAKYGNDNLLFSLAKQLEQLLNWQQNIKLA